MTTDPVPPRTSRPASAPSADRNRVRASNSVSACDESSQTVSSNTSNNEPSPDLQSAEAIRIRSKLADSIISPILNQSHIQQELLVNIDLGLETMTKNANANASKTV